MLTNNKIVTAAFVDAIEHHEDADEFLPDSLSEDEDDYTGPVDELFYDSQPSFALEGDDDLEPVGGETTRADFGSEAGGAVQDANNVAVLLTLLQTDDHSSDEEDDDGLSSDEEDRVDDTFFGFGAAEHESDHVREDHHDDEHVADVTAVEGNDTDLTEQAQCYVIIASEDGPVRCGKAAYTHSVLRLRHIRVEVDNASAIRAKKQGRVSSLAVCQSHYMASQNIIKRPGNSASSDTPFTGSVVMERRLCRLCRTYKHMVGSSRAARYRTPEGKVIHAAFRGPQPYPLREESVREKSESEDARLPFVCIACMEAHMPRTKPLVGKAAKKERVIPDTSFLDAALNKALQEAAVRSKRPAALDALIVEAKEKGAWLAKLTRSTKNIDMANAHLLDISWAHRGVVAFVQGFLEEATKERERSRVRRQEERRAKGVPERARPGILPLLLVFLVNLLVAIRKPRLDTPFRRALTLLSGMQSKARAFRQLLSRANVLSHGVRALQLHRRAAATKLQEQINVFDPTTHEYVYGKLKETGKRNCTCSCVTMCRRMCVDNIDVQSRTFGRTLYDAAKKGIHLVLRVLVSFRKPLDLLCARSLSDILPGRLQGARAYAVECARAVIDAADKAWSEQNANDANVAQQLRKLARRATAAASALRTDRREHDHAHVPEADELYDRCNARLATATEPIIGESMTAALDALNILAPRPPPQQQQQSRTTPASPDVQLMEPDPLPNAPPSAARQGPAAASPQTAMSLEGQPQAAAVPPPPPPPPPLIGITQPLTLFVAELIATLEKTSETDVLDVVKELEMTKLVGPVTPDATTTILPSEEGTATSDAGVTAAVERAFKELEKTATIMIGADQPLFERLAKLRSAARKRTNAPVQWKRTALLLGFFHTSWAAMRALMHATSGFGLHAFAHLVGVVHLDPFDRTASHRASEAALRVIFLAVLRSLARAHRGCRTMEELIAQCEDRNVVHGALAHLARIGSAWIALQRGVRLANWDMQLAGMRALAAVFADLGRSQYAVSSVRFLSEPLDQFAGIHTLHRRAGHAFALDEALESFGVRTTKQQLDGVPNEQILREVIATVEGQMTQVDALLAACGLPHSDPARASAYCDKAMRAGLATLSRELDLVLAMDEAEALASPMLRLSPSFRDTQQLRALASLLVQGELRAHNLWEESVVSETQKPAKGRRAASLRCYVAKKQTPKAKAAALGARFRQVELLIKTVAHMAANATPEQQVAFADVLRVAAEAMPYPPILADPVTGERVSADKSTVLNSLEDQSFWLTTVDARARINSARAGDVVAAIDGTQLIFSLLSVCARSIALSDFVTAFVRAVLDRLGRSINTVYIAFDALARVPAAKAFEQAARDENDHGHRAADALLLERPVTRIDADRFRNNRQLREKLAAAVANELIATPPTHFGRYAVFVDRPSSDGLRTETVRIAPSSGQRRPPEAHAHGEADLATVWHLARTLLASERPADALAVAFIRDIDAVVLALYVSAVFHGLHGVAPQWLVAFRHKDDSSGKWCDVGALCRTLVALLPHLEPDVAIATAAFLFVVAGNDYKETAPLSPPRLVAFYLRHATRFGSLAVKTGDGFSLDEGVALQLLLASLLERAGKELLPPPLSGGVVADAVREAVPDENALRLSVARAAVTCRYFVGALTASGMPLSEWVASGSGFVQRDSHAPLGPANIAIHYGLRIDGTESTFPPQALASKGPGASKAPKAASRAPKKKDSETGDTSRKRRKTK